MESLINNDTFIQYLTYYIKIGIFINKGTDKDVILDKCANFYNRFKTLEAKSDDLTEKDESFIRRSLKRYNLILRIDSDSNPIDIRVRENQLNMINLSPHESIPNDDLDSMLEFAEENKINIFPEIPLTFILRESKYRILLWQYTRALFYLTQLLISSSNDDNDSDRLKIYEESEEKLEEILILIEEIETGIKLKELMAADRFLNHILVKGNINSGKISEAKDEVKKIFKDKGIDTNNSMSRMIDTITDRLSSVDLSGGGNILQDILSISRDVAQELRPDIEKNPDDFGSTIGTITQIFQEVMASPSDSTEEETLPPEMKKIFNSLLSGISNCKFDGSDNFEENLEQLIQNNGLDRNDFYKSITGDDGEIDFQRLETVLTKMNDEERNMQKLK